MKYRGRVKNGQVLLDDAPRLADGTLVEVRPVSPKKGRNGQRAKRNGIARAPAGSPAAILPHVGSWAGGPGEMDHLLGELRRMKEAEVAATKAALGPGTRRAAKPRGGGRVSPASQRKPRP